MRALQSDNSGTNRPQVHSDKTETLIEKADHEKPVHPRRRTWFLQNGRVAGSTRLKEGLIACSSIATSIGGAFLGVGAAFLFATTWPLWIWAAAGSVIASAIVILTLLRPRFDLMRHFVRLSATSD